MSGDLAAQAVPPTIQGSLEWMWMLPEIAAKPSISIDFVNAWRATPGTMFQGESGHLDLFGV